MAFQLKVVHATQAAVSVAPRARKLVIQAHRYLVGQDCYMSPRDTVELLPYILSYL